MLNTVGPSGLARLRSLIAWIAPASGSPIEMWRHRVLAAVLLGMAVFGALAYIPSVWLAVLAGERTVVLVDSIFYGLLLALLIARRLSYRVRAVSMVLLPYVLGVYFLAGFGFEAAGFPWLMAFPVLAAVLLDVRASALCVALMTVTLVVLGWLVARPAFPWAAAMPNATQMWIVSSVSVVMLAGLLTLAIGVLFEGLSRETLRRVAAEREAEQLASAVDQSEGIVLLVEIDGRVAYTNRAAHEFAGERLRIDSLPQWPALVRGEAWAGPLQVERPDGNLLLSGTMSPVRDQDGHVTQVLATLRDVRRERALELRLQQGQKLEAIGTLAGGIAHDFNNLLQPIVLNAESVQAQLPAEHAAQSLLTDIRQAAERARALVRRILSFSRGSDHERVALDLGELLEETEGLLRAVLPPSIALEVRSTRGVIVKGEPGELQQILLNLSTNAMHAMPEGGTLRLDVALLACATDADLAAAFPGVAQVACLSVIDNGRGMDAETLARAFEPFFTTKGPGRGTGLGLAMVHGTVSALGGAMQATSEPGRGTTMRVCLPLTDEAPAHRALTTVESGASRRRQVFVVDDEVAVLMATSRLLERLGWQVTRCSDPLDAARQLRTPTFAADCLMTDLSMPGMTGLQLASLAKSLHPSLPVVLTTGFLEHEELARAEQAGVWRVLRKPFTSSELQDVLTELSGAVDVSVP
jgi:signal transduction histidine kinase/ActR/RegA family two-component response regulator